MPLATHVPILAEARVVLRDGRVVRVRPVRPDDKGRIQDLIERLSPRSRYLRFHHARTRLSERELTDIAESRPPDRCAYVATLDAGDGERIIALGSWWLEPNGRSAEVGFVVDDSIQVQGIGTALLEQLADKAAKYGITQFIGAILAENTRMLQVFEDSGFPTTRELEDDVYTVTLDIVSTEEATRRQAQREHMARAAGVRRLLCPQTIAVIGASRNPTKIGGAVFKNILDGGFSGTVFPVHPGTRSVFGVKAYPTILNIPEDVDLAVIVVPSEQVLDVVDQCGRKGVAGLLVISAGFREVGEEGRLRELALRDKALGYGMRIIGPNCLGIINNDPAVRLNATFSPLNAPPGHISVGSHSGAVGLAVLDQARSINLGIAGFASLGNRVDISSNDLLELWEDEPNTRVILLYLESFGNPQKFSRIARRVSRSKPIIALKSGKSTVGARAATSHTGALAAAEVAVDAMFAQAGVIRVNTIQEMFHTARVLANEPLPRGNSVGILTNAGGLGVMAADECDAAGLAVPHLAEETRERLREFLPPEATVMNPVDTIAGVTGEQFRKALALMLDDPNIDSVIAIYIPTLVTPAEDVAAAIRSVASQRQVEKPLLACLVMARGGIEIRLASDRIVPVFTFPEEAVQALSRARQYARHRSEEAGRLPDRPPADIATARRIVREALGTQDQAWLLPEQAMALLREYGIPAVDTPVAGSPEEAGRVAGALGFPVAMKVRSSTIIHKTDVGGIALGLESEEQVREAYRVMEQGLRRRGLEAEMAGVVLQPMARGGQEMILGMSKDPLFGPLVMVGLGGIHVELLKDVAFALHPLTDLDPDRMLGQLKALPLLRGWRGNPPRDIEALKRTLLNLSVMIEDLDEIDQIEINPLIVRDEGEGGLAIDARVLVKRLESTEGTQAR